MTNDFFDLPIPTSLAFLQMKLTVLGSGTSVPHPHRSSPAFWLQTSVGSILLDIGPDAPHRMAEEQIDWPNLDSIWISHFHLDHFGGLAPFLFSLRWSPQTRERSKPLKLFGPLGLKNVINAINDANNYRLFQLPFPVELIEVAANASFEILPSVAATTTKTPHTKESLALTLTDTGGKVLAYTSDTGFNDELANLAKGADLLLMECSFRRNKSIQTHLELSEVMRVAEQAAPTRMLLGHLYPEWDAVCLSEELRRQNAHPLCELIEASDGLCLKVT